MGKLDIKSKLIMIGDGNCGKTCVLTVYKNGEFLTQYIPTVFESEVFSLTGGNRKIELTVVDSAGQEEYEKLRTILYQNAEVVVVLFSIADPDSLENVGGRWQEEIKKFAPNAKIILVGNKRDLRNDVQTIASLKQRQQEPVKEEKGREMAAYLKAVKYIECSAKDNEGIKDIFEAASSTILESHPSTKSGKCNCAVM